MGDIEFGKNLGLTETSIPGLLLFDLTVNGDSRGWFKENWQRDKMTQLGLPDFGPVQNNVSFNDSVGTTRGIHAEPWDKWVSVATGRIFGAWVDLREGPTFGRVYTAEVDASTAIFVPRGVGNSYQTLEKNTSYTYLVNDHWSPEAEYVFLNLGDETAAINWPIPLAAAKVSDKDRAHPRLAGVQPVAPRKILVLGASGQVGRALREEFAGATNIEWATRSDLDLTSPELHSSRRWKEYAVIVNAAASTAVDEAETEAGRRDAWATNAQGAASLARIALEFGITLIHVSSDYVFDGEAKGAYTEDHAFSPLGVYGQSKAAGDIAVATVPAHYIVRTSWVIGDGKNFVQTMASLARKGIDPDVVDDQYGRLTFARDIARFIQHLLTERPAHGTYNLTSDGDTLTWADVARSVFTLTGHDAARINGVSTAAYFANSPAPTAPRPRNSKLDLAKVRRTGFVPCDGQVALTQYLND